MMQNHLLIIFQPSIKSDLSYGADFEGFPYFIKFIFLAYFLFLGGPLRAPGPGPFKGPLGPKGPPWALLRAWAS